ncbi:S-methyl-5-thioribose-1-phosphate isomerase [Butyrivibrio sp. MC2013]|uniref:S-methyl-5-thioribose-1-phosphate isomerase n=1 Tax=Butyrivibrio sp. MC2013 TaxID=1280686 RepID=UPI0004222CA4|nr:S-methyl-5-thioribose-1-phosphate isomerase [Butyrivibrio sp. MC2013]
MNNVFDYETVALVDEDDAIEIIDQTLLPGECKLIRLRTGQEIWDAIYLLQVRGAPAIGVTAGFGIYLLTKTSKASSYEEFLAELKEHKDFLNSSRPTAVNLSWALNRMEEHIRDYYAKLMAQDSECGFDKLLPLLIKEMRAEAETIKEEDIKVCRKIGEYGLSLIKDGDGILTHCNAGKLATIKYGTATAPIYMAHEKGLAIKAYCDETRPLLQGARLTAFELSSAGIDTTLLCDNMSGSLMRSGKIQAIFVGCDRVAANGDVANKIGTSMVATLAAYYHISFYVCAPTSTIDLDCKSGDDIVIEQRKAAEVTDMWYEKPMAPEGINVYNPAFDITDNSLITAIITEKGIFRKPYDLKVSLQ